MIKIFFLKSKRTFLDDGLTVGGHPHGDALVEATFLTLVPGHFVNHTLAVVLAGVGWVEVLLDGPSEEALRGRQRGEEGLEGLEGLEGRGGAYLAAFAGDAAVVVAGGLVPTHDA